MTRVAAILAAVALVLLLGISSATGDTPPAEHHVYLPIAHNVPVITLPTALVPCPCGVTATPWPVPTLIPPFSMTVTPRR
jgi:hypothetical protein